MVKILYCALNKFLISVIAGILVLGVIGIEQQVFAPEEQPEKLNLGGNGYNTDSQSFEITALVQLPKDAPVGYTVETTLEIFKPDGTPIRAKVSTDSVPQEGVAEGGNNHSVHKILISIPYDPSEDSLEDKGIKVGVTSELLNPDGGSVAQVARSPTPIHIVAKDPHADSKPKEIIVVGSKVKDVVRSAKLLECTFTLHSNGGGPRGGEEPETITVPANQGQTVKLPDIDDEVLTADIICIYEDRTEGPVLGGVELQEQGTTIIHYQDTKLEKTCGCDKIDLGLVDPDDFDDIRAELKNLGQKPFPPEKFGEQNPLVSVTEQKIQGFGKSIVVEVVAVWDKTIFCFVVEPDPKAKCSGKISFGVGDNFKIDGEFDSPLPKEFFGEAKIFENGKVQFVNKPANGAPPFDVECKGDCLVDEDEESIGNRHLFATYYRAVFPGETGVLSGDLSFSVSAECGPQKKIQDDVKRKWQMDLKFKDGELDFANSDFDGDVQGANGVDPDDYNGPPRP